MTGNFTLEKHPAMQDVALMILAEEPHATDPSRVTLDVAWWNIGKCHAPYSMGIFQEIHVTREWLKELKDYKYEGKSCGLPLK